jgi:hypothetical protein
VTIREPRLYLHLLGKASTDYIEDESSIAPLLENS